MDLVYLYRATGSEELRMSLRSVSANLPHARLWFVGDRPPSWVKNYEWIPGNLKLSAPQNVFDNVRLAANCEDISDQFYVMNDDFYVLKPVDQVDMAWRGTLDAHLATVKPSNRAWHESLVITRTWLHDLGYKRPRSYELHRPFPVDRRLMAATLDMAADIRPDLPPQWRTIYGVINKAGGKKSTDVKINSNALVDLDKHTFVSSDERVFHYNTSCRELRVRFSTPCAYEAHL
jgi:hypothetical protein